MRDYSTLKGVSTMSLNGEDRKRYILDQVDKKGNVKVKQLADELDVSTESIRQYLIQMEKENKLKRVYGGAVKASYNQVEPSFFSRENINYQAKGKIGKAACELINKHDVVIIDEGSTTLQMVKHLIEIEDITIITNSVAVLSLLIDYDIKSMFQGEIIFLGGKVDSENYRTTGMITERIASHFYADHAFLATEGISMQHGLTSYSAERALLSRKFIECAKQTTVLVDHTKFNKRMYYKISDMKSIDNIVVDKTPPADWNINEQNLNWIVAPEIDV